MAKNQKKTFVPDTNVILHDYRSIVPLEKGERSRLADIASDLL